MTMNTSPNPSPVSSAAPKNYTSVARLPVTSAPTGVLGTDRLYSLLPAIYRIRDGAVGEPLRALLATLEQEVKALETDIDTLYEDWFIETCAEWVVPYIGDLLGVHQLYAEQANQQPNQPSGGYGQQERRAYIANTLAYRRRKGTTPILEQLGRDVTGWPAKVIEFGKLLATTQHLDHIRPASTTVNLRVNNRLQEIGTPFEQQAAYSAEIRSATQGGRYGLSHMGLFVWRLQSYPMVRSQAKAISNTNGTLTGRHYSFHPFGTSVPLFNQPQSETDMVARAQEINLPVRLRRPVLAAELTQRREALLTGKSLDATRYFDSDPVLQIFVDGQSTPIAPEEILIGDLEDLSSEALPVADRNYRQNESASENQNAQTQSKEPKLEDFLSPKVVVDPTLGRMAFWGSNLPQRVDVSYHYGFSDDIGGGPYGRNQSGFRPLTSVSSPQVLDPLRWDIRQADTADCNPLKIAIETWNQTTTVWQGFEDATHVPLVTFAIPPVIVATLGTPAQRFSPGIVSSGLMVKTGLCPSEILVGSGIAIDRQGRQLIVPKHRTLDIAQLGINQLPRCTGVLILIYQDLGSAQLQVVNPATIEPLPEGVVIPLALIRVDEQNQQVIALDTSVRSELVAGIVQGLSVRKRSGTLEAWLTSGTGVDSQGQPIVMVENQPIDLTGEQGSVRAVVLTKQRSDWMLQLISTESEAAMTAAHIHLATLDIPNVIIDQESIQAVGDTTDSTKTGLDVTSRTNTAEVEVSAGSMVQDGEPFFTLEETAMLDLSAYAGRSLTLFVSPRANQGLPLLKAPPDTAAGGIGVVPTEPMGEAAYVGEIVVGDNATYCGDLPVLITPHRHLSIIAAEGYRPHISGDFQVWAIAPQNPGKLSLNGLLIEGAIYVLPGNLQQLNISHCTLASHKAGITVIEPEPNGSEPESDEDISLITVLLYGVTILWQLIGQDLGLCSSDSSSLTFSKTMRLITAQFMHWIATLERVCQSNQESWAWESRQDHPQLSISLYRTLSGSICLARSVPKLSLQDCVIDSDGYDKTSSSALSAPGAHVQIDTCTILGRTRVRALSATNCLFTQKVTVQQRQTGCVRFCYVPITSRTPRRYQCQPDRALQKNLTRIPGGISALFAQADQIICGLSGDGIFQQQLASAKDVSPGDASAEDVSTEIKPDPSPAEWRERSGDLPNRYTSVIALYTPPSQTPPFQTPSETTKLASQLLIGTLNGQLFHTPLALPSEVNTEDWRRLPFPDTNTPISVLLSDQQPGLGQVTVIGTQVKGQNTAFEHELTAIDIDQSGDLISINGSAPRQIVAIGRMGIGSLTLQATKVVSSLPQTPLLSLGDTLTIQQQTRKIVAFDESDPTIPILNEAFSPNIRTTDIFKINNNTELTLSAALDADIEQPTAYSTHQFWVATRGSGPWRIPAAALTHLTNTHADSSSSWRAVHAELPERTTTSLIRTHTSQLWLSTATAGVFRLIRDLRPNSIQEAWLPENVGLLSHHINVLIEDTQQQLLVGTAQGIFRRPANTDCWQPISTLPAYNITTLIAYTHANTHFLLAGTTDGKLLRSFDSGNSWTPLSLDLRSISITTLTVSSSPFHNTPPPAGTTDAPPLLHLGTATGDILRSYDHGVTWQTLHQTLPHMADKLRILRQLQPAFTATDSGSPGYCQLTQTGAPELLTGAEDGAEMGVFNSLKQPQRAANLKASLHDYLRFGLTAGIFYMT